MIISLHAAPSFLQPHEDESSPLSCRLFPHTRQQQDDYLLLSCSTALLCQYDLCQNVYKCENFLLNFSTTKFTEKQKGNDKN